MRDRLGFSKWVNKFPNNPTQSRYTRFVRQPQGEIKTMFTDSRNKFKEVLNKSLKTHYSEYFDD